MLEVFVSKLLMDSFGRILVVFTPGNDMGVEAPGDGAGGLIRDGGGGAGRTSLGGNRAGGVTTGGSSWASGRGGLGDLPWLVEGRPAGGDRRADGAAASGTAATEVGADHDVVQVGGEALLVGAKEELVNALVTSGLAAPREAASGELG